MSSPVPPMDTAIKDESSMDVDMPPGNPGSPMIAGTSMPSSPVASGNISEVSPQKLTENAAASHACGKEPHAFELPDAEFEAPIPRTPQSVQDVFGALMRAALDLGLSEVAEEGGVHLRIATLCSGTDAPVFALRELQEAAASLGLGNVVSFDHIFSAEIETFKQAFIRRNVKPDGPVFRDVQEMAKFDMAMNAEGFLEEVSHDVDILVFGSSCVDFSNLNNSKKALGRGTGVDISKADYTVEEPDVEKFLEKILDRVKGESSRTFLAGLLYISKYRPSIVIMENVISAPWDEIADFWFAKIGYVATYRKCNSKDYGMPHIRVRGYLIAVDFREFAGDSEDIPGDERLIQHRRVLEKAPKSLRVNEARMCQMRHAEARASEGLPTGNRYTMMDHRGHCVPREDSFQESISDLGEREKDLLDITYERGLQKQYDMNHKLLIYDISQNVDRAPGQLGMTPCLTPKGNPFVTNQGRPLLGLEAVGLQGIDIDRIVPSIETQMQLQDLAGNAMTTTVVGATLLSSLLAIESLPQKRLARPARHYVNTMLDETEDEKTPVVFEDSDPIDLEDTEQIRHEQLDTMSSEDRRSLFEDCSSYCPCESPHTRTADAEILQCVTCHEVRCSDCVGNPRHHMLPVSLHEFQVRERATAVEIVKRLANHAFVLCSPENLPANPESVPEPYLTIPSLEEMEPSSVPVDPDLERVIALCRDNVRLAYEKVHVGQDLTIFYQSANVYMHVVIERYAVVWMVFVKDSSWISREYDHLHDWSKPILMAVVDHKRLYAVPRPEDWCMWVADEIKATLCITGLKSRRFKLTLENAQWLNNGKWKSIIRFHPFWTRFVRLIQGEYTYSDQCAVSRGRILAKHVEEMRDMYLFEDPGLISAPEDDQWVFAWSNRRLQTFEIRDVLATMRNFPETMPCNNGIDTVKTEISILGWWTGNPRDLPKSTDLVLRERETGPSKLRIPPPFDGVHIHPHVFRPVLKSIQDANHEEYGCNPTPFVTVRVVVDKLHWPNALFPMLLRHDSMAFKFGVDSDGWLTLPLRFHADIMKLIYHHFKSITEESLVECLDTHAGTLDVRRSDFKNCPLCAPPTPRVSGIVNSDSRIIELISDQAECWHFEECIRKRPSPLQIQVRTIPGVLLEDGIEKSHIEVRISLNMEALIHRAGGYLPRPAYALVKQYKEEVLVRADIETWYEEDEMRGRTPFIQEVQTTTAGCSSANVQSMEQPPSFILNGQRLRPDQLASLRWMVEERGKKVESFQEREIEEYMVPNLNMRLTGEVARDNYAQGGVLAHEVGYGKTVVSLAMLDYGRQDFEKSLLDRKAVATEGIIHLKASLVIVPQHLVKQWCSEAETFLQNPLQPWKIVTIDSRKDVVELDRNELESADLIVASFRDIQLNQPRLDALAVIGGQLRINEKESGRRLADWYERAISWIRPPVKEKGDGDGDGDEQNDPRDCADIDNLTEEHLQQMLNEVEEAKKARIPQSSRRSGAAADTNQDSEVVSGLNQSWRSSVGQPSQLWKSGSVLELYSFASIVYDEFSYNEEHVVLFFKHALATSKWILSGTPPLSHLGQICKMAGLLNVHIAREEAAIPPHLPKITQGLSTKDMSQAERFRSYRQLKSSAFVAERDEQARRFIHSFIRRNCAIQGNYNLTELIVPVTMNPASSLLYHVVQQSLFDAKWVFDDVQGDLREMIAELSSSKAARQGRPVPLSAKKYLEVAAEVLMMYGSGCATDLMAAMRMPVANVDGTKDRYSVETLLRGLYLKQMDQIRLLCKPIKSQWDRMMYLSERLEKDPTFNLQTAPATDPRKTKQSGAIKLRDSIIHDIFKSETPSEIQSILRRMIFNGLNPSPEMLERLREDKLTFADCKWAGHEGGPAVYTVLDWYPQFMNALDFEDHGKTERAAILAAALWAIKDLASVATLEGSLQLQAEIKDFIETKLDTMCFAEMTKLLESARSRERLLQPFDENEVNCGFVGPNAPEFHYCRAIGLKCMPNEGKVQLATKLDRFSSGNARETEFEFQRVLPYFHPHYGQSKLTRGASIDAGLDDFIMTVQSLERGIKNHLVPAFQRYRLLTLAQSLVHEHALQCQVCRRQLPVGIQHHDQIFCLVTCGHVYCSQCASGFRVDEDYHCRVLECGCASRGSLISVKNMLPLDFDDGSQLSAAETSSKVAKIATLTSEIIERGDAVLIFAQFDYLKENIATVLTERNIKHGRTDGPDSAEQLAAFQQGRFPVLLQSLMSTESAGSNLTIANHIIFAAPLMTDKYSWDMYMRQAIGRCNRPGQTKNVWVYHMVTRFTIEADVFEQRFPDWELKLADSAVVLSRETEREMASVDEDGDVVMPEDENEKEGCFLLPCLKMNEPAGRLMSESTYARALFDSREIVRLLSAFDDDTAEE
ncbi:hypothetical protein BROUX41_000254 [Berkeleyomyces rouxiae]|uniref:uncharacterized protein n=1 Tax=Berkeleyomyces rouxiae TaxID=2035830 RepID=UPI003B7680D8